MAGTFTQTGVRELRAAIERFPDEQTAALKAVARDTAERVRDRARSGLLAQLKTDAHALADAIEITEDLPNKQYLVTSKPPSGQPANITIWNEHGTINMNARPYMRPAADAENARYHAEVEAASAKAAARTFKE